MEKGRKLPAWAFAVPPVMAFGLFLIYFSQVRDQAFAAHLVANPLVYDIEARQILAGQPYGRAFFMSPLYPGFVALIYRLARPDHLLVPHAQGVLLALNVLLLGLMSRRLLDDVLALTASSIMVFYWSFYYFAGELVPATLVVTFVLLAVLLFLERNRKPLLPPLIGGLLFAASITIMRGLPGLSHPGRGGAYLAGFLLVVVFAAGSLILLSVVFMSSKLRRFTNLAASGLLARIACLVWGATLLLAVPLFAMLLRTKRHRAVGAPGGPAGPVLFIMALSIPLAASLSHNYAASGEPVLITASFGVNLFIGNNPSSDGMDPFRLGVNSSIRREADRLGLTGAGRSRFFAGEAQDFIRNQTGEWFRLMGKKVLLSLSRFEIDNNADISERQSHWRHLFLPKLHFGIIFPLALAGMLAVLRGRGDRRLPVWGFLCFTALCIGFFVCERFRLPGIVFLFPLAAAAGLAVRASARGVKYAWLALVLIPLGAAVSNIDFYGLAGYEFPSIIANKAYVERLDGDMVRARRLSYLAISRDPGVAGAYHQLGAIEEAEGNPEEAIRYYLETLERDPYFSASYGAAAGILEDAGISTTYLERYVEESVHGGRLEDLKGQILQFVRERHSEASGPAQ